MTEAALPALINSATARWPRLGAACRKIGSISKRRRQVSRRASSERIKSEKSIGATLVHTPPGLDRTIELGAPAACGSALSLDGRFVASATVDGYTHLIDVASGRTLRTLPNIVDSKRCPTLAFSADGNRLVASGTSTGTVVVWETFRMNSSIARIIPSSTASVRSAMPWRWRRLGRMSRVAPSRVLDARPGAPLLDLRRQIPDALALDPHSPEQIDGALRAHDMVIYCICPDSATALEALRASITNGRPLRESIGRFIRPVCSGAM